MESKKNKIGRPPPNWLLSLTPGCYSLDEIVKKSGTTKSTARITLKHYGATASYIVEKSGTAKAFYTWRGFILDE
jgi:hypothetical protein